MKWVEMNMVTPVARQRINARGWLVEDEKIGLVDDGHRERQPLPYAQGNIAGALIEIILETKPADEFVDARLRLLRHQVEEARMKIEVLANGKLGVERKRLRHIADAIAGAHVSARGGLAKQERLSPGRRKEAGQHLHRRRLAAAVRAEKAEDFAAVDGEAHAIDRGKVPEAAGEAARHDDRDSVEATAGRDRQPAMAAALLFGQQRDEPLLEGRRARGRLDFGGRPAGENLPGAHRREPVEPLRLLHVGGGDDHAHGLAAGSHTLDQLPELPARQRIDAGRRLIEDQEIGIVDEAAAKTKLLAHAAGELLRQAIAEGRKPGAVQQFGDSRVPLRGRLPEQPAEKLDVLADSEVGVEVLAQALRHVGDARADPEPVGRIRHVAAQDECLAGLDLAGAGDDAEQRRLPHAVWADQARHAAGWDFDLDAVERDRRSIALRDPLDPRDRASALDHGDGFPRRAGGHSTDRSCFT